MIQLEKNIFSWVEKLYILLKREFVCFQLYKTYLYNFRWKHGFPINFTEKLSMCRRAVCREASLTRGRLWWPSIMLLQPSWNLPSLCRARLYVATIGICERFGRKKRFYALSLYKTPNTVTDHTCCLCSANSESGVRWYPGPQLYQLPG